MTVRCYSVVSSLVVIAVSAMQQGLLSNLRRMGFVIRYR